MKTSNILLTVAVALFVLVSLSSNLVLKNQFDKIDKNDKFYGFTKHPVSAFRYVHLKGKGFALTQIESGTSPEIRMLTLPQYMDLKMSGDTLVMTYKPDWELGYQPRGGGFGSLPSIYIIAPKLEGIISDNVRCVVKDYRFDDLTVIQKGDGLLLNNSSVRNFTATISDYAYLKLNPDSRIETANIDIRDSSTLNAEKDIFKDFHARIDSSAYISMPGSMLKKMMTGNKITPR